MTDHLEIHTLELEKWRANRGRASPAVEGWMAFFAEAYRGAEIPPEIKTPPLEEAMSILKEFKTNARWNDAYRSRLDWQRRQISQERAVAESRAEAAAARAAEEEQRAAKDAERAAKERNGRLPTTIGCGSV